MKKKEALKIVEKALKKGIVYNGETVNVGVVYLAEFNDDYFPVIEVSFDDHSEMRFLQDQSGMFSTKIAVAPWIAIVLPLDESQRAVALQNSQINFSAHGETTKNTSSNGKAGMIIARDLFVEVLSSL